MGRAGTPVDLGQHRAGLGHAGLGARDQPTECPGIAREELLQQDG